MTRSGDTFTAAIPASYADTAYPPRVYFFVLTDPSGDGWLAPGFDAALSHQPHHSAMPR